MQFSNILITGGFGFIGSNFINLYKENFNFIVLDKFTYAANQKNILDQNIKIYKGDISDSNLVKIILENENIDAVINFAAESHVDNSINSPHVFIDTNIVGTYNLLITCNEYLKTKKDFRFIHISTDEVFGSLALNDDKFNIGSRYDPRSPYSASKAASDHLVRAWMHTYNFPAIITNCSNNYGPNQHEEKLIPKIIKCILQNKKIPIYGNGNNIRDWIHVNDHANGIFLALTKGKISDTYLFGGDAEKTNLEVANLICTIMNELKPGNENYKNLISFVEDRKGHDFRYAIDNSYANKNLGFKLQFSFETGIKETINWYINNADRFNFSSN